MSLVHKVIILNKPLKIRGFTVWQWILLAVSVAVAFIFGAKVPHDWKLGNLPLGFIVGLLIVCGAMVFVGASEMKPLAWWRNLFLYRLGLAPRVFFPHVEEQGHPYPDPDIIDQPRASEDNYIELGT